MELITIKAKRRGKVADEKNREVTYQGVGKFVDDETAEGGKRLVTAGVVTDIKDALAAEGGNMQSLLDNWAEGFNKSQYEAVSDVLADYIDSSWNEGQVKAFRLAVNNLMKLGASVEKAVASAKAFIS
jgi:hypothetical protein